MKTFEEMEYFQPMEELVAVLMKKTQNHNPLFFRVLTSYYMALVASMMRVSIQTHDRGNIPVNMYALALQTSGSGKGHSTNILEEQVINGFRDRFIAQTMPVVSEVNLDKIAKDRSSKKSTDYEDELTIVQKEYEQAGVIPFSFDSGTTPAVRQIRHKLLLSDIGSINLQIDEIGRNLIGNTEILNMYLECYTPDVEVLTNKGYKRFDSLTGEEDIYQYNEDGTVSLVNNSEVVFIAKDYDGLLYNFSTPTGFSFSVTENHSMTISHNDKLIKKLPSEVNTADRIITCKALSDRGEHISDVLRLQLAFQADGSFKSYERIEFTFTKERKKKRLISILNSLGIAYSVYELNTGQTCYSFRTDIKLTKNLKDILDFNKLDLTSANEILDEITHWDGSLNNGCSRYTSTNLENIELIATIASLSGHKSRVRYIEDTRSEKFSDTGYVEWNHRTDLTSASLSYLDKQSQNTSPIRSTSKYIGKVYCVAVPSSHIIIRREGLTCVGGNCYDVGRIKGKLIKNTKENIRNEEVDGRVPTNMFLFGTPVALLNGGKTEEEFYDMLSTGYARRCFFGYVSKIDKKLHLTPEEVYDMLTDSSIETVIEKMHKRLRKLADPINHNATLTMDKSVALLVIEYRLHCERLAEEYPDHDEISKAEISHRYYKALKLSGAYAFVAGLPEITMDIMYSAIKLAEESGEAFNRILSRDRNYVRLAKYISSVKGEVTDVDMMEDLPFYKGSVANRRDLMQLATAYGYKNNIIIKRKVSDGIEFFTGESLKETNLNRLVISHSNDITEGFVSEYAPWDKLYKLLTLDNHHYTAHHFKDGYRCSANALQGFNLVILDVDGGMSLGLAKELLKGFKALYAVTKRHTEEANRFRIIMPLSHNLELTPIQYSKFMENIFKWLPFSVDDQTKDIARKWCTNPGTYEYVEGELLDVMMFIPETKKEEEQSKRVIDYQHLNNLERWFVLNMDTGNRNNMLLKYAYMLVDYGYDFDKTRSSVYELNSKLPDPLQEEELDRTISVSILKKLSTRK